MPDSPPNAFTFGLSFEVDLGGGPRRIAFAVPRDATDDEVRGLFDRAFAELAKMRHGRAAELGQGDAAPTPGAS